MRVVYLAAGAAGMYCGSCMQDNRVAAELQALGHDVVLVPLYTPLRTDETDVSTQRVYYGGLNVYLQQVSAVFRHTPWLLDRLLDAPALLNHLNRWAGSTRAEDLGALTLSVLRGAAGAQRKELSKLVRGLRQLQPGLVHLPNLMFAGVAGTLREKLGVPVACGLTGEDIFLDGLPEPFRTGVFELLRARGGDVDAFIAPTQYYARHAVQHFGLPAERVHVVPMGIRTADFASESSELPREPFVIGYLAHVCPPKGLALLVEAFVRLRLAGRNCRLRAAGYLGPADRAYLDDVNETLMAGDAVDAFEYVGEVDRAGKTRFLQSLHVLSVPTRYVESKGYYVLEALASGVPVVQPEHGSFPELIASTRGGLLCSPNDAVALADTLAGLMDDGPLRRQLAVQGRAAVQAEFGAEKMARATWALYETVVQSCRPSVAQTC